jgi:hypothetical protein
MNHDDITQLTGAIKSVKNILWWIALWTFINLFNGK